jgi:hypothetical protein
VSSDLLQFGNRDSNLDVVVLGSLARGEVTRDSDFDYLVVAHGLSKQPDETRLLLTRVDELREKLNLLGPGQTGMFGRVVAAPDLTERIGLEQDTNNTHSLRILLLEESRSVRYPALHDALVEAILGRYLVEYRQPKIGVPRFLLNDVVRYWRTLAVDYQAKRWGEWTRATGRAEGLKWGLRYLKLRVSRKLAYAGTLASLLLPAALQQPADVLLLKQQFALPALARLAQLHSVFPSDGNHERQALGAVLKIADEFVGMLANHEARTAVSSVTDPHSEPNDTHFGRWRQRGNDLQEALEVIFFRSKLLGDLSRRYLSF